MKKLVFGFLMIVQSLGCLATVDRRTTKTPNTRRVHFEDEPLKNNAVSVQFVHFDARLKYLSPQAPMPIKCSELEPLNFQQCCIAISFMVMIWADCGCNILEKNPADKLPVCNQSQIPWCARVAFDDGKANAIKKPQQPKEREMWPRQVPKKYSKLLQNKRKDNRIQRP